MTTLRAEYLATLRRALAAGGLSSAELARRAGVHVKTIRRLRAGCSVSLTTLDALADALGVASPAQIEGDLRATVLEILEHRGQVDSERCNVVQDGAPVVGWRQAAIRLDVSRWTLWRHREAAGDDSEPWWPNEAALLAWYAAIRAEGRRREAGALAALHAREAEP